jgi:hypothetical protein
MITKYASIVLLAAITFFLAACGGLQSGTTPTVSNGSRAVVVSGGNGGMTTIYLPSEDGRDVVMLSNGKSPACKDCQAAAKKYFLTGELEEKCPTCGGTRTVFSVPSNTGHN